MALYMVHPVLLAVPAAAAIVYVWYRHKVAKRRRLAVLWAGGLDDMSGTQFEKLLRAVFESLGYAVRHHGKAGDFGVDLMLTGEGGRRIAVQAKRYRGNVGNKAVQEVYAGMAKWKADDGWVITNSHFTRAAVEQAKSCGVRLVDREELLDIIAEARHAQVGGSQ